VAGICTRKQVPRLKMDIELSASMLYLQGSSQDFRIKYSSLIRIFLLPKPNMPQTVVVLTLDPPIRQGKTFYAHVLLQVRKQTPPPGCYTTWEHRSLFQQQTVLRTFWCLAGQLESHADFWRRPAVSRGRGVGRDVGAGRGEPGYQIPGQAGGACLGQLSVSAVSDVQFEPRLEMFL
jgi:hypothetical protein